MTHLIAWAVLQRDDGAVLLARRAGASGGNGLWGLPGGHAERGEAWTDAAVREAAEEVGVVIDPAGLEPLGVHRYVDDDYHGIDAFFRARRWRGTPRPVAECSEVDWFDPRALPADSLPWLARALADHLGGTWFVEVGFPAGGRSDG